MVKTGKRELVTGRGRISRIFKIEETLLSFIFLLVIILNAIILADLFLSILKSPVTLISIRVIIMLTILGFLVANSARHPEIKGRGWAFMVVGFTLVFLGSVIELLPMLQFIAPMFQHLDTSMLFLLRTLLLELLGYFCLAYGFFLWIPAIIESRRKIEDTAGALDR
ncbi:MAG: hypothetical protein U9P14_03090, partial [Gemmatimonadota bacterium]|nr:hypothetical protein [Gemmatimonadota bacterium]